MFVFFIIMYFNFFKKYFNICYTLQEEQEQIDIEEQSKLASKINNSSVTQFEETRRNFNRHRSILISNQEMRNSVMLNDQFTRRSIVGQKHRNSKKVSSNNENALRERAKSHIETLHLNNMENIDAIGRGHSVTKSLIITDENDPKSIQQQSFHAHTLNFTQSASYPLLSTSIFTKRIHDLKIKNSHPISKVWPNEPIILTGDSLGFEAKDTG